MPLTTFLILRSGPKDRVSKDAKHDLQSRSRILKRSLRHTARRNGA
jgi:hypothetical protein